MKRNSLAKHTAIALPIIGGIIAGAVLFSSFGFYMAMLTGATSRTTSLPAIKNTSTTYKNDFGKFSITLPADHIVTVNESCEGGCLQIISVYKRSDESAYLPLDLIISAQKRDGITLADWKTAYFASNNPEIISPPTEQKIGNVTATKYVVAGLTNTTHYFFVRENTAYAISVGENTPATATTSILQSFAFTN